jgi:hypothetical protein
MYHCEGTGRILFHDNLLMPGQGVFVRKSRRRTRVFSHKSDMPAQGLLTRIARMGVNAPETDLILHSQFFILPWF